jgi:hypothetical protein
MNSRLLLPIIITLGFYYQCFGKKKGGGRWSIFNKKTTSGEMARDTPPLKDRRNKCLISSAQTATERTKLN